MDQIQWQGLDGVARIFSISTAYESIRPTAGTVPWFDAIWFPNCVPRHIMSRFSKSPFFECRYSTDVWNHALEYTQITSSHEWSMVASDTVGFRANKSAASLVAKLLFGATIYFIWQERNSRLFNSKKRAAKELFGVIYSTVRLKLLSVQFKESCQIDQLRIACKLK
ncbi:uncharacterized protein [Rutidosis leptorrhynchoides]|uniref:uncharacterized protein n=1 Tax=Rutidosis leptorrhynchoides TaxID=125765 RepID=UPI003A98D3CA